MEQKNYKLTSLEGFVNEYAQNGWACTDQIFQPEYLKALAKECLKLHSEGHFSKAAIGHQGSKTIINNIRGDYTLWLEDAPPSPLIQTFLFFLDEFRLLLNQEFFISLKRAESHFALYPPQTNYNKHVDNHKGSGARKVTFVLYLNENWQSGHGGELTLFSPDNEDEVLKTIEPLLGRLVLFRSELFPHQVEQSHVPRLSLTGWFRDDIV